jgi:hypothetical protein
MTEALGWRLLACIILSSCLSVRAEWRAALGRLQRASVDAGYESVAFIQYVLWATQDAALKKSLLEDLRDYVANAPEEIDFESEVSSSKGHGPDKKRFIELEGGLRLLQKYRVDKSYFESSARIEEIAYVFDEKWDLGIVPFTARRNFGEFQSAVQVWVPKATVAREVKSSHSALPKYIWMKAYDYIVNNADRHANNYLIAEQVIGIDNAWGFRGLGAVHAVPVRLPESIVGEKDFARHISQGSDEEIRAIMKAFNLGESTQDFVLARRYEVLKIIGSGEEKKAFNAAVPFPPMRPWKLGIESVINLQNAELINDLKREESEGQARLRDVKHEAKIVFKIDALGAEKIGALSLRYASRRGCVVVVRFRGADRQVLARRALRETGGEDKFENVWIPLADVVDRKADIVVEIFDPWWQRDRLAAHIDKIALLQEARAPRSLRHATTLSPDLKVGEELTLGEQKWKILSEVGKGGYGRVFRIQDETGAIRALKVSLGGEQRDRVVTVEERQRFELLSQVEGARVPVYYVVGKNFVIKDFFEGQLARRFLENFDGSRREDLHKLSKLLVQFRKLAAAGVYAPIHNTKNWLWDGEDWVNIDTSDRMRNGISEYEALLGYVKAFKSEWLKHNPDKLKAVMGDDLQKMLEDPFYLPNYEAGCQDALTTSATDVAA